MQKIVEVLFLQQHRKLLHDKKMYKTFPVNLLFVFLKCFTLSETTLSEVNFTLDLVLYVCYHITTTPPEVEVLPIL